MPSIDDPLHIGSRRWIAWKLVQLAHRIYDASFYERITIKHKSGEVVCEIDVQSDMYGAGVMSMFGSEFGDYEIEWDEFKPEWL